jgi:hypothetical protein
MGLAPNTHYLQGSVATMEHVLPLEFKIYHLAWDHFEMVHAK